MLFNSLDFAIFLPLVFAVFWLTSRKSVKIQNLVIVVASYIFYGWWDLRFLSLIFLSTIVDFSVGRELKGEKNPRRRKIYLYLSVFVNIGILGFFKYYNFFIENFVEAFSLFGAEISSNTLNIILPVGISFYTFQTLSYTIDVYKKSLEPTSDFIAFMAFVSFFPQLVAGPIERATNLLPQFYANKKFDYGKAVDGMRQILWGLFKKMVVADNCAIFANQIFNNSSEMNGSTLALGAIFFSFQIYGDFSGYSDIAIGTARLFGFDLMRNFAFPYFSRNIAEFWRRWHISLSSWFRDYIYIPLGGSHGSIWYKIRNTMVIFVISGFWHGANWTFIVWGVLNAIYFLPLMLTNNNRKYLDIVAKDRKFPALNELVKISFTFFITVFAWIFFRADSLSHAFNYISRMFSKSLFTIPDFWDQKRALVTIILVLFFILIEWRGRKGQYALADFGIKWNRIYRWAFYSFIIFIIGMYMPLHENPFIYFQF